MTARDEAIEAMASVFKLRWSSREDNCADLLDAIPPTVLARLAIEQGALKWVHVGEDVGGTQYVYDSTGWTAELSPDDSVLWMVKR